MIKLHLRSRAGLLHVLAYSCRWLTGVQCCHAGILLAVTIIYQYFEAYEKEKAQGGMLF